MQNIINKLFFAVSTILLCYGNSYAQEIDFGTYSSAYSVTVSELSLGDELDFGLVVQNEGLVNIPISNAVVLTIEGVKYLDVIVDVTAPANLTHTGACSGNCSLPFTLQAAYTNQGTNNTANAVLMNVASNIASAQFPIKFRGNAPPGPPPTPVYQGFDPSLFNETAYLYIFGSVTLGAQNAGSYEGTINVTVTYD